MTVFKTSNARRIAVEREIEAARIKRERIEREINHRIAAKAVAKNR